MTGEQVVWLVVAQHGTVQPASIPQCSIGRQTQYAGTVVTQYTVHKQYAQYTVQTPHTVNKALTIHTIHADQT